MGGCPEHIAQFRVNSVSDIFIITFKVGEFGERKMYFNLEEFGMIKNFMEINVNIIIDEVGLTRSLREQYINLAYKYNYHITVLILPKLSMKESVDRRLNNPHGQPNRKLWEDIWTRFDSSYEPPIFDEGIDIILEFNNKGVLHETNKRKK